MTTTDDAGLEPVEPEAAGEPAPSVVLATEPDPVTPAPGRAPAAWLLPALLGCAVGILVGASGLFVAQQVLASRTHNSALERATQSCTDSGTGFGLEIGDSGRTLTIDTQGEEDSSGTDIVYGLCVLTKLGVPDSVMSRIEQTTSLDGQQEAAWDGIDATWSYHPDRGLDMVLTVN